MKILSTVSSVSAHTTHHADSILKDKFPSALAELEGILQYFSISTNEVITGGGGESTITQRLRRKFETQEWCKKNVEEQHIVDGVALAAISHEG